MLSECGKMPVNSRHSAQPSDWVVGYSLYYAIIPPPAFASVLFRTTRAWPRLRRGGAWACAWGACLSLDLFCYFFASRQKRVKKNLKSDHQAQNTFGVYARAMRLRFTQASTSLSIGSDLRLTHSPAKIHGELGSALRLLDGAEACFVLVDVFL